MDCVTLLQQAYSAGLTVRSGGDRLVVRGPRRAEALARELLEHKREVLMRLSIEELPPGWRAEFEERAAIREYEAGQSRDAAEAEAIKEIRARMAAVESSDDSG